VSRFLTAHQHNYAIQCHSRWFTLEIQDRRQIKKDTTKTKHSPEKANNARYSRNFSRLIRHSATKRGGIILQHSCVVE